MSNAYKILTLVIISAVIIAGIITPLPDIMNIQADKMDEGAFRQAAIFRVIFFHVPMAWLAVLAFFISMIHSINHLRKNDLTYDTKAYSAAGIGFLFSFLATITGSVWAKFQWGSFWNWDPRETSIFILLLIYGAYFALRSAIDNPEQRAKLSSVYAIIAFVTVPFFIFIMPRIVESLHPDPIINTKGKIHMNSKMLMIFISSLVGFTLLFFWIYNLKIRSEILKHKKQLND
jgi:heme exporter protein C